MVDITELAVDAYCLGIEAFRDKYQDSQIGLCSFTNKSWGKVIGPAMTSYWRYRDEFPDNEVTITVGPP